jgi:hypothetical protein
MLVCKIARNCVSNPRKNTILTISKQRNNTIRATFYNTCPARISEKKLSQWSDDKQLYVEGHLCRRQQIQAENTEQGRKGYGKQTAKRRRCHSYDGISWNADDSPKSPKIQRFRQNLPKMPSIRLNSPKCQNLCSRNSPKMPTFRRNSPKMPAIRRNSPKILIIHSNSPKMPTFCQISPKMPMIRRNWPERNFQRVTATLRPQFLATF